jgi:L-lysine exporter family protein LysE/ArgO
MTPILSAALSGFFLGASLIIAIGAQNAFILRQGLLKSHVFVLCLICALSDAVLIAAGVAGLGTLIRQSPLLIELVTLGGAIFLAVYAIKAFQRMAHAGSLQESADNAMSLKSAVLTCLAFTFLNPHVYLDTVLLVGSLSSVYEGRAQLAFGVGAATSSFVWFFALGYGARLLQPVFRKPAAWRVLDGVIGIVMSALALSLVLSV